VQGWQEGGITFNPTYKYHLGCNIYSGDPLPPGVSAVKAVESYASLTDSEATTEGEWRGHSMLGFVLRDLGFVRKSLSCGRRPNNFTYLWAPAQHLQ
jgi:hypothetical protein